MFHDVAWRTHGPARQDLNMRARSTSFRRISPSYLDLSGGSCKPRRIYSLIQHHARVIPYPTVVVRIISTEINCVK